MGRSVAQGLVLLLMSSLVAAQGPLLRSKRYGFSLPVLPGWAQDYDAIDRGDVPPDTVLVVRRPQSSQHLGAWCIVETRDAHGATMEEIVQSGLEHLPDVQGKSIRQAMTTRSGYPSSHSVWTSVNEEHLMENDQLAVLRPGKLLLVTCVAHQSDYSVYASQFETILAGFQVEKQ